MLFVKRKETSQVTSIDQISSAEVTHAVEDEGPAALPELQHNLRLLVELTESDIHKLTREIEHTKNTAVHLSKERDRAAKVLQREGEDIAATEDVCEMIEKCEIQLNERKKSHASVDERLSLVEKVFEHLLAKYPKHVQQLQLTKLAAAWGWPLFKALMHTWQPLDAPNELVYKHLATWKMLFHSGGDTDVFMRLLHEIVLDRVRLIVSSQWRVRQYEPTVRLFESLKQVVPPRLYQDVLGQLVVPVLKRAVEAWNPRVDPVPLQNWIHPWLGVIKQYTLEPVHQVCVDPLESIVMVFSR